ncbi:MAG: ABC transporter permease [Planctomycetota bacterium]|jgi:putative ABC transport system permease protein|nr:ABC transporter permease [Planctomycetota bacterium]
MPLRLLAKVGLNSLLANKLRSFLAVLGIIIGVGAVISMLALGAGTRESILSRVSSLGTNLLIIRPGQAGRRGVMSGPAQTLTLEDAKAIVESVDSVLWVAPVVAGTGQLKYFNKNVSVSLSGVTASYFQVRGFEVDRGRSFTGLETDQGGRVVVLGSTTAQNLFGDTYPIGETIKVRGVNHQVIGVLKSRGDQGWYNPDDQALIPLPTAMKQVMGTERLREIDLVGVEGSENKPIIKEVSQLLRRRHHLVGSAEDDFNVQDQAEVVEMASSFSSTLTILLGSLAGISLLVGGIGIMNIMLVTVAERTREIGLRKAIGAKERDILGQFLFESVLVSGAGGILGVLFGVGLAVLIPHAARILSGAEFSTLVEIDSIILALVVSAGVGIFFGYYPARRAAKLDPVEALRHE